jgi:hypothetical protein
VQHITQSPPKISSFLEVRVHGSLSGYVWAKECRREDKHGQLGIWDARAPTEEVDDADSDQGEAGRYWRLQVHWPATPQSSISCIKFDPIDAHSVSPPTVSCSYSPSPSRTQGIYECIRLYRSLAVLHLWYLVRSFRYGQCSDYKHGPPPREP